MNFYFDESIREAGGFIIGALVGSSEDLNEVVRSEWRKLGLDPQLFEYKSSHTKKKSNSQHLLRDHISAILANYGTIGVVVSPLNERRNLGSACAKLLAQLASRHHFDTNGSSILYVDQGIEFSNHEEDSVRKIGVTAIPNCDSRSVSGLQVADHAAHILGSMLLETLGVLTKKVPSPYREEFGIEAIDLGWELWSKIRYNFFSVANCDPTNSDEIPFAIVEGHGLLVSPTCGPELCNAANKCFGSSYLGCTV